jgi:ketosteroid isomerase-like protein
VKQWVIVFCLAISLSIFAGCQTSGANDASGTTANANTASAPANRTAAKPSIDEIREALAAHDKALSDKNLDAVMGTFSTDPTTVVLGTGTEERWVGPQEIRAAYTEIFKDYDPGTLQTNCDWKTGGSDDAGTMAWLAAACAAKDSLQGKAREYKLNVSGTVAKQPDGKWRFVVLHMSNAFQPPVTK